MAVTSLVVDPSKRTPLHAVPERNNESPFSIMARWQAFLDVSGKCNERTRQRYRRTVSNLWADLADTNWNGTREPLDVTQADLVAYVSDIDSRGEARAIAIKSFRSFYGFAWDEGVIKMNPAERMRTGKRKYGPAPSLSRDKTEQLLEAAERLDPRARWAIQLQYTTGCRVGSLLALEARDLQEGGAGPVIHFRVAKGDKPYAVPAAERALEAWRKLMDLETYVPKGAKRQQTLVGISYRVYEGWLKDASRIAGFDATSHLLRHTAITRWAESGVDTRTIVELANWEDGSLLRRYATASDPNMRTAVDML